MKIKEFLHKKNVLVSYKVYLIDVLGNMAMGLFASLLIGTILNTIGTHTGLKFLSEELWPLCKDMTGPAIPAAIMTMLTTEANSWGMACENVVRLFGVPPCFGNGLQPYP